jgi:hypothetical protein
MRKEKSQTEREQREKDSEKEGSLWEKEKGSNLGGKVLYGRKREKICRVRVGGEKEGGHERKGRRRRKGVKYACIVKNERSRHGQEYIVLQKMILCVRAHL